MISISTQKVHTWKKKLQNPKMKGTTYFLQQGGAVNVTASADHQELCARVLGKTNHKHSLESYLLWKDVKATDLVELIYEMDKY